MQLSLSIPTRAQIIDGGFVVTIARTGTEWLKAQLGDYADKSGVYILHSNGKILYIGKTTLGKFGTFCRTSSAALPREGIRKQFAISMPMQPESPGHWTLVDHHVNVHEIQEVRMLLIGIMSLPKIAQMPPRSNQALQRTRTGGPRLCLHHWFDAPARAAELVRWADE